MIKASKSDDKRIEVVIEGSSAEISAEFCAIYTSMKNDFSEEMVAALLYVMAEGDMEKAENQEAPMA